MDNKIDTEEVWDINVTTELMEDHPKAGNISAIDKSSVHRICSGQVVLTLATAVKELVENSVDAGATIVDVKLKEYGADCIEVSDNGYGVEKKNFPGLTLKHHTSKLQDFSDLINVETFGFRGEALSSLCALGDMTIITRHKDTQVGTKLEFDHHGNISKQTPQARQIGTTVTIHNLFYTLPVRHKEFQRNVKKEFVRMVQVLNSYCIISTGVRITCTNMTGKGSRSTVISTKGNTTLRENIANIFGPKQLQNLMEFKQKNPGEETCSEFGIQPAGQSLFRMEGFVSHCEHGRGRSSADRQFYFINGRPFDSTKVVKVIHEVYHQFNRHQYPFVVMVITMDKDSVDVNVTPDKRQVFLQGEKAMLATIKASLVAMYEPTSSVLQLQLPASLSRTVSCSLPAGSSGSHGNSLDFKAEDKMEKPVSALTKLKRSFRSAFARPDRETEEHSTENISKQINKQPRMDNFVSRISSTNTEQSNCTSAEETDTTGNDPVRDGDDVESERVETVLPVTATAFVVDCNTDNDQPDKVTQSQQFTHLQGSTLGNVTISHHHSDSLTDHPKPADRIEDCVIVSEDSETDAVILEGKEREDKEMIMSSEQISGRGVTHEIVPNDSGTHSSHKGNIGSVSAEDCASDVLDSQGLNPSLATSTSPYIDLKNCDAVLHELDEKEEVKRTEKVVNFSLQKLKALTLERSERKNGDDGFCRNFRAAISPSDNQAAEQELQKEIKKEMFGQMKILGQFNLGFIITRLGEDLFIVDQHASDEKFNFEMLQKNTVIQSQRLIQPMGLELTASSETILIDHLDTFKKNGFEFIINEEAEPTQRVKLVSTPVSKNWMFGKEDIEEMIFMLTESPGVLCRPSRVRQMFASRSCRKSVMIGTALNKSEMKKLVGHMGDIEQPWNCPHGRPTMRHLINVNMVPR